MKNNNRTWEALSMKDRASFIKLAMQNGYRDLDSIRSLYNNSLKGTEPITVANKYDGGGHKTYRDYVPSSNQFDLEGYRYNNSWEGRINGGLYTRSTSDSDNDEVVIDNITVTGKNPYKGVLSEAAMSNVKGWTNKIMNGEATLNDVPVPMRTAVGNYLLGEQAGRDMRIGRDQNYEGLAMAMNAIPLAIGAQAILPAIPADKVKKGVDSVSHVGKVLMNPAAAKTEAGTIASILFDATGTAYGLDQNINLLGKAIKGDATWEDTINFGLNTLGIVPYINTTKNSINTLNPIINNIKEGFPEFISHMGKYPLSTIQGMFKKTDLDWDTWSKSGKAVPKYRQYQYRTLENKLKSLGQDINKIANELDIDPRAYIQMNSPQFINNGYHPTVYYKGSPIPNATHFPKPTDPDYIPALGRSTGSEGIYFGDRNNYTLERYTKPRIGLFESSEPTGKVYKVAVKGNKANLLDLPLENRRWDMPYKLFTEDREAIEKLGYNFIENPYNKGLGGRKNEFFVFEPNQLKSLEGNIGTFNPKFKNIYKALGGPLYNDDNPIEAFQGNPYIPVVRYENGGGIHIKPSKKGTFTAAAKKRNMGVQEFASKVLANKEDYSPAMVKKANFARNAKKFKH